MVASKKNTKVIESLTPEQEAKMDEYAEYWEKVGLDTSPANRVDAEKTITRIYELIGKKQPEFIWVNSYEEACKAISEGSGTDVRAQNNFFSGQHHAGWSGWYRYYKEVLGIKFEKEDMELAELWTALSISCGWWWPFEGVVVCCEKYKNIQLDDNGELHCEDGYAVSYRGDAGGEFFWHGVSVSSQIIMSPATLTIEQIDKEENAEVRRIMMERYGVGKYMIEAGAEMLDMDTLTLEGSAPRALYQTKDGQKWLVGTDGSTARVYWMSVPLEAKSCAEAHNMISGFDESRLIAEC